jgi:hypothetical protein
MIRAFVPSPLSRQLLAAFAAAGVLSLSAASAIAVPIPYANCGKPGDILSIQQFDALVWPPTGTPAPLQAMATYDPVTGNLINLRFTLLFGVDWILEANGLDIPVVNGFVALPASLPMLLVGPTLPIAAGPYNTLEVLTSSNPGALPVTIQCKATVGQAVTSANAVLTLTYNGSPGFPALGGSGAYQATVQVTGNTGREVFCATFSLANISFASQTLSVPTLSARMRLLLAALLAAAALFVLRYRA